MGIALFLALILSLCFAAVLIQDLDPLLAGAFLVGVICCLVVVFTMVALEDTCQTYGKFSVGRALYQCQQIQEGK
ncbi:hypothetical protein [uncultured Haemophilus sp.]|uniref:hypothetical protein n=1 Tax=uncultured Haemophilus sp. TaxID=237779 RepID=UPI00280477AD|nr:hypothetical protein [uncultured Haemophilus sp.]